MFPFPSIVFSMVFWHLFPTFSIRSDLQVQVPGGQALSSVEAQQRSATTRDLGKAQPGGKVMEKTHGKNMEKPWKNEVFQALKMCSIRLSMFFSSGFFSKNTWKAWWNTWSLDEFGHTEKMMENMMEEMMDKKHDILGPPKKKKNIQKEVYHNFQTNFGCRTPGPTVLFL